ncbi:MAG: class I SAM-dependent methyltransferase [Saprospiraceae bacterium]
MSLKQTNNLSNRLLEIVQALPLKSGIRVLEIGCGPAAMAREISKRIGDGHILAIDRSDKAIKQALLGSKTEMESGRLSIRKIEIENFELLPGEELFDIAVAIRVGVLDGRHPEREKESLDRISKALKKNGNLYIDGGNPLKEIKFGTSIKSK